MNAEMKAGLAAGLPCVLVLGALVALAVHRGQRPETPPFLRPGDRVEAYDSQGRRIEFVGSWNNTAVVEGFRYDGDVVIRWPLDENGDSGGWADVPPSMLKRVP